MVTHHNGIVPSSKGLSASLSDCGTFEESPRKVNHQFVVIIMELKKQSLYYYGDCFYYIHLFLIDTKYAVYTFTKHFHASTSGLEMTKIAFLIKYVICRYVLVFKSVR